MSKARSTVRDKMEFVNFHVKLMLLVLSPAADLERANKGTHYRVYWTKTNEEKWCEGNAGESVRLWSPAEQ